MDSGGEYHNFDRSSTAVVLGLFDTGLAAVRSLGRVGVPVLGLDSDPRQPGFKSRLCAARVCPDPVCQPQALLEYMVREGRQLDRPAVLFPSSDAYVLFCSRCRDELKPYFRLALPSSEVVETLVNKRAQYELAERRGIPYAATCYPETGEDVWRIKDEVDYPAFIKPYYAHLWRTRFDNKGFRVDSPEELVQKFELVLANRLPAMVQTVIPGPPTNNFEASFYVDRSGDTPVFFTVRKLRQFPPEFGVGTLVETVHCPRLVTLACDLIDGLDYRGFGNLEFKLDPRDSELKLIELNVRLWQQNDQAAACGINFPLRQYLDLTGQAVPQNASFPTGVKWVDPMADFQSFWHYFRHGELSPSAWLGSWRGARSFAVFARDDPLPALASLEYGRKILRLPLYLLKHRAARRA